jgi:hypothetical protein
MQPILRLVPATLSATAAASIDPLLAQSVTPTEHATQTATSGVLLALAALSVLALLAFVVLRLTRGPGDTRPKSEPPPRRHPDERAPVR